MTLLHLLALASAAQAPGLSQVRAQQFVSACVEGRIEKSQIADEITSRELPNSLARRYKLRSGHHYYRLTSQPQAFLLLMPYDDPKAAYTMMCVLAAAGVRLQTTYGHVVTRLAGHPRPIGPSNIEAADYTDLKGGYRLSAAKLGSMIVLEAGQFTPRGLREAEAAQRKLLGLPPKPRHK